MTRRGLCARNSTPCRAAKEVYIFDLEKSHVLSNPINIKYEPRAADSTDAFLEMKSVLLASNKKEEERERLRIKRI